MRKIDGPAFDEGGRADETARARPAPLSMTPTAPKRVRRERAIGKVVLLAVVTAYLAFVLLAPLGSLLFATWELGFGEAWAAVTEPLAQDALYTSAVLVACAVAVNAVIGTFGAVALVRHRFFGRGIISAMCDLPLAVSPVMIGLSFILLVGRGGVLDPVLEAIGLKVVFTFWGILLGTLFVTLPYTIREVAYVLEEIGTDEEEAATTLGASPWQTFFRVTLPNVRIALGYGLLMAAARTLGEFGAVLVLGGSISDQTQTATTFIHDSIEERQLSAAYGMAVLLAMCSVLLLLSLEWMKERQAAARHRSRSVTEDEVTT
jgi:sulfate/thiosulfate transport system permease protein